MEEEKWMEGKGKEKRMKRAQQHAGFNGGITESKEGKRMEEKALNRH